MAITCSRDLDVKTWRTSTVFHQSSNFEWLLLYLTNKLLNQYCSVSLPILFTGWSNLTWLVLSFYEIWTERLGDQWVGWPLGHPQQLGDSFRRIKFHPCSKPPEMRVQNGTKMRFHGTSRLRAGCKLELGQGTNSNDFLTSLGKLQWKRTPTGWNMKYKC